MLIIQNNIGNKIYSPTSIIPVITEYSEKKATYPICVTGQGAGLKKDSIINLSQIRTIDKRRLIGPKITTLPMNL